MNIRSKLFYAYTALSAIYAATFLLPRQIFNLPQLANGDYRLFRLTVLIPVLSIWYIAFYGYAKLRRYSKLIANTPDGLQVAKITKGVLILAVGLPVISICNSLLNMLGHHYHDFAPSAAIVRTYISLILPLIGFIYISQGAYGLGQLAKHRPRLRATHILAAVYVVISVIYCYAIASSRHLEAIYHLQPWLIMTTIVIPYLYMWYIGLLAAYEIHLYSRNVPGQLYGKTWNLLAAGLGAIIIMQIVVQYVSTVTVGLTSLRFVRLFLIVYVLLASLAVGYMLVAIGAKRLQKIEEV